MNKTLQKASMLRSKVKNTFVTNKHEGNRNNYSMQRNVCVTLQQKNKREYFGDSVQKTYLKTSFFGLQ